MTFKDLQIAEPISRAISEKGYERPTPIQEKGIPVALAGRDMMGIAQTGTGKTAVFAIPIIQHLEAARAAEDDQRPDERGDEGHEGRQDAGSDGRSRESVSEGQSYDVQQTAGSDERSGESGAQKSQSGQDGQGSQSGRDGRANGTENCRDGSGRENGRGRGRGRGRGKAQSPQKRVIKALVLTPTRELALQIGESFADYGRYTSLKYTTVFGGVKQAPQVQQLKNGVDVLIATPGRLLDLIGQGLVRLDTVTHFVLDEADRMLDMGFITDIRRLLPMLPAKRQTLFFSATMPHDIVVLSRSILTDPVRVEVTPVSSTVDTIDQCIYFVEKPEKKSLLISLLREEAGKSVLIFSRTKHGADNISRTLKKSGILNEAIHGDKSQVQRQKALNDFKSGKVKVMVATDIAARGLDIQELEMVINYDLPDIPETYIHRIGRTGRAGHNGRALTFCTQDEHMMVKDIQKLTGKQLNMVLHQS